MRCSNCNAPLGNNDQYCNHCGQKVENSIPINENINSKHNISISLKELRKRAFKTYEGNFLFILASVVVAMGISTIPVAGIFVMGPIMVGLSGIIFFIIRRKNKPEFFTIFDGFKNIEKHMVLGLLQALFIALWSLLFIIPGIVKRYSYSMSYHIAIDKPHLTASETIDESRRLMNGNKGKLFLLHLSFLGWIILSILTFGIGFFFLIPYIKLAEAHFYLELTQGYVNEEKLEELPIPTE